MNLAPWRRARAPKLTTEAEQTGSVEELGFVDLTGRRKAAGRSIRLVDMARRLPQLVRRSIALAWQVDRWAAVGLLVCQVASGVMQALGLLAVSGTLTALLASGDIYDRLFQAWPSLAMLAAAAGVRALWASP